MMPTRQAEAVEDGAHPLRVALGQVVVDRDHMHAAAGHRVEAAASGATRVLPSPVFISAILPWCSTMPPMQLDIEVPHAQLAPADLAGRREYLGQRVVEDRAAGA